MNPATCRFCGLERVEHPNDPAPGACPRCLERRLVDAKRRARTEAELTPAMAYATLREIGLTDVAARALIREFRGAT